MRSTILDSAVRPVVIVLFDPTGDRCSLFIQAPILRRPDFLLFQAAMEPFDVAIAFRLDDTPSADREGLQRHAQGREAFISALRQVNGAFRCVDRL
jgi:hypothetical protein